MNELNPSIQRAEASHLADSESERQWRLAPTVDADMLKRIPIALAVLFGTLDYLVFNVVFRGEQAAFLSAYAHLSLLALPKVMGIMGIHTENFCFWEHPLTGSLMYAALGCCLGWGIRYMEQKHET